MKKMIAILALCAFVSVSSAAIMFQAPATVNAGETFTVTVVANEVTSGWQIGALTMTGQASFAGNASNGALSTGLANGTVAAANTGNVVLVTMGGSSTTATVAAGTALFSINITAGAAGSTIVVNDYVGTRLAIGLPNGPNFATKLNTIVATLDAATINVVPEPMTMALLGLGGLFIRRRRA